MEKIPKISVIVPVYNVEKYLHKCIDSILSQTFTDFELLLIDDGSKDNSGIICDEYAKIDKRVRVFHKENGGVSSARNMGLDNALGEWIAFVDSDDWVDVVFFENFISGIINDTRIDLIIQGINFVDSDNVVFDQLSYAPLTCSTRDFVKLFNELELTKKSYVWNKLFKRKVVDSFIIRFDEEVKIWEDTLFLTDFLSSSNWIGFVNEVCYNYQDRLDSSVKKIFTPNDYLKILELYLDIVYNKLQINLLDFESLKSDMTMFVHYYMLSIKHKSRKLNWKKRKEYLNLLYVKQYYRYLSDITFFSRLRKYLIKSQRFKILDLLYSVIVIPLNSKT